MNTAYTKTLGIKIKKARKEAGLSQKDISRALTISDKAVSAYEVGRNQPTLEILEKISTITHKPITYFSDGDQHEATLKEKLMTIERELTEVKKLLKKKGSR
jgi:transcriptional regulator with XRE-family HTH domain